MNGLRAYIVAFGFIALILMQSWVVVAETESVQVDFEADPMFANINVPINIDNATVEDTVIGEWARDLGEDMPNGTYYGSLLPPALFRNNAVASWWTDDDLAEHGRFTFVTVSAHFNLTEQQIMAGASEWWVRAPFDPVSIEASAGMVLAIFADQNDTTEVTLYDGWNNGGTGRLYENTAPRPTIDGLVPDVYVPIWPLGDFEWIQTVGKSFTMFDNQDMFRMENGHLYIRVDAVIMPSRDYVLTFAFRMPPNESLYTYWSTAETPTGRTSIVAFYEMEIADNGNVTRLDKSEMNFSLDLDISFVFVEGVGYGGMFGKKVEVHQGTTLVVYPFLNTSRSGDQYPSFCLPFISNETVGIHPQIHQGSGSSPGDSLHTWHFNAAGGEGSWYTYWFNPSGIITTVLAEKAQKGNMSVVVDDPTGLYVGMYIVIDDDDSPGQADVIQAIDGDEIFISQPLLWAMELSENADLTGYADVYYDYNDFILFSSNRTLDWATFDDDDRWNVAVYLTFNNTANITLLCSDQARPSVNWSELNNRWNSSLTPWGRPSISDPWYAPNSRHTIAWMAYDVWMSGRGTDGQWAQVDTDSDGMVSYNYHFPNRIELSSGTWYLYNESDEKPFIWQELWELAKENYAAGHFLKALKYGFMTVVAFLVEGGLSVYGYIKDGLHDAMRVVQRWGEMIVTRIIEFAGWIYNIVQEAIDTIAGWWSAFKYLIAPMVMILFIGLTSKIAAWLFMGRQMGVKV